MSIISRLKSVFTRKTNKINSVMNFPVFLQLYNTSSSETASAVMIIEYIRKFSHDLQFLEKLFHHLSNEMMTNNILSIQLAKQKFPEKALEVLKKYNHPKIYWLYFSSIWNMSRYENARNAIKPSYIKSIVKLSKKVFKLDKRAINTYLGALSNLCLKNEFKHLIVDVDFDADIPLEGNQETLCGLFANLFVDDDIIDELIDCKTLHKLIQSKKPFEERTLWRNYLALIQNSINKTQYYLVKYNQITEFNKFEKTLDSDENDPNDVRFMLTTARNNLELDNFEDNKLESAIKYAYTDLVRDFIYEEMDLKEKDYLNLAFDYQDGNDEIIKMLIFAGAKSDNIEDNDDKQVYKKYLNQKNKIHNTYEQKIKIEFDEVKNQYEPHLLGLINSYIDIRPDVF